MLDPEALAQDLRAFLAPSDVADMPADAADSAARLATAYVRFLRAATSLRVLGAGAALLEGALAARLAARFEAETNSDSFLGAFVDAFQAVAASTLVAGAVVIHAGAFVGTASELLADTVERALRGELTAGEALGQVAHSLAAGTAAVLVTLPGGVTETFR